MKVQNAGVRLSGAKQFIRLARCDLIFSIYAARSCWGGGCADPTTDHSIAKSMPKDQQDALIQACLADDGTARNDSNSARRKQYSLRLTVR